MNAHDAELVLEQVVAEKITARTGIARLVAGGWSALEAEQLVFIALGGSDVVEVGADGREYYFGSGKLVSEVAAAMAK